MRIMNYVKKGLLTLVLAGNLFMGKVESSPEKYAVLINGSEEQEFSVMEDRIYKSLLKMKFKKDKIYILNCSGNLESLATKKNVKKMFSSLEKRIDENDLLLVHFLDHGSRITIFYDGKPKELSAVVLKDEYLNENEIYNCLSEIRPRTGVITTDTCYGGGIAKKIGKGNFIGISSSDENESAFFFWSQSFMVEFYDAFREKGADVNNDNKISIKEAFDYAQNYVKILPKKMNPLLISEIDADSVTLE